MLDLLAKLLMVTCLLAWAVRRSSNDRRSRPSAATAGPRSVLSQCWWGAEQWLASPRFIHDARPRHWRHLPRPRAFPSCWSFGASCGRTCWAPIGLNCITCVDQVHAGGKGTATRRDMAAARRRALRTSGQTHPVCSPPGWVRKRPVHAPPLGTGRIFLDTAEQESGL